MIIDRPSPYKSIAVRIGFYFCAVDKKLFECNQSFFLQAAQKLVIQLIQYISSQFGILELIESITFRLLTVGKPDKSEVSFTQFHNTVNSSYPPHICVSDYSIHHNWVIPVSSLI